MNWKFWSPHLKICRIYKWKNISVTKPSCFSQRATYNDHNCRNCITLQENSLSDGLLFHIFVQMGLLRNYMTLYHHLQVYELLLTPSWSIMSIFIYTLIQPTFYSLIIFLGLRERLWNNSSSNKTRPCPGRGFLFSGYIKTWRVLYIKLFTSQALFPQDTQRASLPLLHKSLGLPRVSILVLILDVIVFGWKSPTLTNFGCRTLFFCLKCNY